MFKNWYARIGLAAVIAVAAPVTLEAQDVTIGVKGGLNSADLSISEDPVSINTDSRTGFVGGLFAQFNLGDVIAIRPEGLFSQKGASATEEGVDIELQLDYIELPVLALARIPTGGMVRPVLFAGPVISFETTCGVEGSEGGISISADCDAVDDDPILTKGTDFGVAFGGGLEIESGNLLFLLDGRYTLGLTDINDVASAPETFKNRAWSFMGGVGIRVN